MRILVLGGGNSPERDVSLRSAKAVAQAARSAGYEVDEADPRDGLDILNQITPDTIIFPILHGTNGEDGDIQKELEARGLPYLGSDSRSSAACFNKWLTRRQLESNGVPLPIGILVTRDSYRNQELANKPHALKILHGGSSIGTLLVKKQKNVSDEQLDVLFSLDSSAVLEQFIDGMEVTVPILDQRALPVIEIVPPKGEQFDYENKYNGRTQEICPPLSVSPDLQKKSQELAEMTHRAMKCRHLSRTDIMIDKNGRLYVLEINTMPGLTDQSLYPRSAAADGLSMPELVKKFVELVKRDYNL